jgi:hypothetical protein
MEAPNEHSGAGPPMAAPASARRAATGSAEVVICLENLVKMKRVFEVCGMKSSDSTHFEQTQMCLCREACQVDATA